MAHENDSFIREVNEELRSEQLRNVWSRYGKILIGAAVLVVVGTASVGIYEYWNERRASQYGDQFSAALKLASENKTEEALAALAALEKGGHGGYPVLARLRTATLQAEAGDTAAAISTFAAIGNDSSAPAIVRDLAKIRGAWLLIDTGTYEQVAAEVEALTDQNNPMRHSAREALALSAYKAEDFAKAKEWFTQIADDVIAPRNISSRARIMLDNIAASGKAP